jgi:hypothetical protein
VQGKAIGAPTAHNALNAFWRCPFTNRAFTAQCILMLATLTIFMSTVTSIIFSLFSKNPHFPYPHPNRIIRPIRHPILPMSIDIGGRIRMIGGVGTRMVSDGFG